MISKLNLQVYLFIVVLLFSCSDRGSELYTLENNVIKLPYNEGELSILAITDNIINVRYEDSLTYSDRNYAPILQGSQPFDITEGKNVLSLKTTSVEVNIVFEPFSINYLDLNAGKKLSTTSMFEREGDTTRFKFNLDEAEAIYGTGARALPLNRRGYRLQNYNKASYAYQMGAELLNYCIPHVTSSKKYMLLIDNPARSFFDIGKKDQNVLDFSSLGGNMSYYFINGSSHKELISSYTELTGKQELPPIWAFGNLQSRFGYRNQKEALTLLDKSLDAGYPVDALILDIYWFGPELQDGQMGKLDWDFEKWPNPKQMITDFDSRGVNTITVSEPFFTLKSGRFEDLQSKGFLAKDSTGNAMPLPHFYFGEAGLLDIFNAEAQEWIWKEYLRQDEYNIDGWWVDLGEPEVHPDSIIHVNGLGREVHGAYGHEWAKVLHKGYEKDYPNERLFHMGRAGFAGTQRYSMIPWSGDVSRTWSGLKAQLPVMLGIGMSGIGYMHADAGGFSFVESANPELYTRWLQFAAFTPVFRPHADEVVAPEPVTWSKEVQDNVKPSIDLRYQMLPYNYTLAWGNMATGIPMARPMFVEYENISDTLMTQYMWGENLLISPILKSGLTERTTYLPNGKWYNFHSGKMFEGGQWVTEPLESDKIPVYAKGGSVIPKVEGMQNTKSYHTTNKLELTYYYQEGESSNKVYFDDGKTKNAFKESAYQLISINSEAGTSQITLNITQEGNGYEGAPESRKVEMNIIGVGNPNKVEVDGKEAKFEIDEGKVSFTFEQTQNHIIRIEL